LGPGQSAASPQRATFENRHNRAEINFRFVLKTFDGAARGIRTPDPLITNEVLYQLSYCGALALTTRAQSPGAVYDDFGLLGNIPVVPEHGLAWLAWAHARGTHDGRPLGSRRNVA
jgi:hypothetical protein